LYQPGAHILSELKVKNIELLQNVSSFKVYLEQLIQQHELEQIGETYHQFPEAGFTALVCLTESHISVHTWPEFEYLTFDVFLSNFKRDNSAKTQAIAEGIIKYFEGEIIQFQTIKR
jgi:S-adenosylmethionine decarboxylase